MHGFHHNAHTRQAHKPGNAAAGGTMTHGEMIGSAAPGDGNPRSIKVLMYHRIVDTVSLSLAYPSMCIHAAEFRRHLALLERWGWTPITFEDYHLYTLGELNLPKKPVVLTFDDGYADTHELAFPLLQEFGMKAVVFVLGDRRMAASTWDHRAGIPVGPLMTDEQVLELHAAGFEIGSHSMTHRRLPELSRADAWEEISRSRHVLEILLNAPVRSFAYPFGCVCAEAKKMVEDAGYALGIAAYSGPAAFGADRFEVRRFLMENSTDGTGLWFRMGTPFEYVAWARWRAKLIFSRHTDGIPAADGGNA